MTGNHKHHHMTGRSAKAELVRRIGELRAYGLTWVQIGERLGYEGYSLSTFYKNGGRWKVKAAR